MPLVSGNGGGRGAEGRRAVTGCLIKEVSGAVPAGTARGADRRVALVLPVYFGLLVVRSLTECALFALQ